MSSVMENDVTDEDIVTEIEELLEENQFGATSEDMFLRNDTEYDPAVMDVNEENATEVLDVVENETEEIELLLTEDSEVPDPNVENASEEVSPPKKSKKEESTRYKPLNLPLTRIKQIIKMDPDVHLAGADAVFLIAKAAELFIEMLSKDAYKITVSSKKKTIQKKDVDAAIQNTDALVFLDGAMDF